ncbi:hypothetical protein C4K04_3433 [Pseudomonas chlororaphis]|uniref:Uncharacterized protein n=1 Tax=Pseudomonas chlororaphis TaxID=587753 RepID=A0A3G7TPQ0_9PSED|nr:hypothetical protein [Pseudomonas chlororaphis]AZE49105.1 hypothetical protein C4K04_3433 [Pseudomonas chlororaphis]
MIINESVIPHAANPGPIDRSALLFLEADRLYEQAYALLKEPVSTQSMGEFSAAKKRADEKYLQARQEWLNARPRINR